MNINDVNNLKVGMWVKTITGLVAKVTHIDMRFPLSQTEKFPIIYTDDNKACWSCDGILQYGWEEIH